MNEPKICRICNADPGMHKPDCPALSRPDIKLEPRNDWPDFYRLEECDGPSPAGAVACISRDNKLYWVVAHHSGPDYHRVFMEPGYIMGCPFCGRAPVFDGRLVECSDPDEDCPGNGNKCTVSAWNNRCEQGVMFLKEKCPGYGQTAPHAFDEAWQTVAGCASDRSLGNQIWDMGRKQLAEQIAQYLRDHPEEAGRDAAAMIETFA